jgi:hypothetical protein
VEAAPLSRLTITSMAEPPLRVGGVLGLHQARELAGIGKCGCSIAGPRRPFWSWLAPRPALAAITGSAPSTVSPYSPRLTPSPRWPFRLRDDQERGFINSGRVETTLTLPSHQHFLQVAIESPSALISPTQPSYGAAWLLFAPAETHSNAKRHKLSAIPPIKA